jgi:hypothetical protein
MANAALDVVRTRFVLHLGLDPVHVDIPGDLYEKLRAAVRELMSGPGAGGGSVLVLPQVTSGGEQGYGACTAMPALDEAVFDAWRGLEGGREGAVVQVRAGPSCCHPWLETVHGPHVGGG